MNLSETQKFLLARALQARQLKLESSIAFGTDWRSMIGSSDHDESPHALLEKGDECDILRSRLACLDERERTILVLRYGLEGETPLTLKEIGRRLGVTREWVRKIEVRAVRKLDTTHEDLPSAGRQRSTRSRQSTRQASEEIVGCPGRRTGRRQAQTTSDPTLISGLDPTWCAPSPGRCRGSLRWRSLKTRRGRRTIVAPAIELACVRPRSEACRNLRNDGTSAR